MWEQVEELLILLFFSAIQKHVQVLKSSLMKLIIAYHNNLRKYEWNAMTNNFFINHSQFA